MADITDTLKGRFDPRLKPLWITGGFRNPECGVVDPATNEIYVSCMTRGGDASLRAQGYVSRLSLAGDVLDEKWITGLNVPSGISVRGSRLYVADVDRLRVFDTASARQIAEYRAAGAKFLDGMAVDAHSGDLFVSDIAGNAIWRLQDDRWERWLEDTRLDFPNGMVAEKDRLVVGSHGLWEALRGWKPEATQDCKGHLLAVDLATKQITDIGDGSPIAHHDGLASDGADGYITSDYPYATLIHVDRQGRTSTLAQFEPMGSNSPMSDEAKAIHARYGHSCGPADLRYDRERRLLLVPLCTSGHLVAFDYSPASMVDGVVPSTDQQETTT